MAAVGRCRVDGSWTGAVPEIPVSVCGDAVIAGVEILRWRDCGISLFDLPELRSEKGCVYNTGLSSLPVTAVSVDGPAKWANAHALCNVCVVGGSASRVFMW